MQLQQIRNNEGGSIVLSSLMVIILIALGLIQTQFNGHISDMKSQLTIGQKSGQIWLLKSLESVAGGEMTLRNSRFSVNEVLRQCLSGHPSPCNESQFYPLVLYPATPLMIYEAGAYPIAPSNLKPIAGDLDIQSSLPKVFYTDAGELCVNVSRASKSCPLQAVARFRPLCGGSLMQPELSSVNGSPCAGAANGIEIQVGVGFLFKGNLIYRGDTSNSGDTRVFRYSSSIFHN